jgi:hypothetical protein
VTVYQKDTGRATEFPLTIYITTVKDGELTDALLSEFVTVYYRKATAGTLDTPTFTAASLPSTSDGDNKWTSYLLGGTQTCPYVYKSEGTHYYQKGTDEDGEEIKITSAYGDFSEPTLYKVYNNMGVDQEGYAEFYKATNGGKGAGFQEYTDKNGEQVTVAVAEQLYIKNGDTELIKALGDTVQIAGWDVTENSLSKGTIANAESMVLSPGGLYGGSIAGSPNNQEWVIGAGENFGVTSNGTMYAENASVRGKIVATEG